VLKTSSAQAAHPRNMEAAAPTPEPSAVETSIDVHEDKDEYDSDTDSEESVTSDRSYRPSFELEDFHLKPLPTILTSTTEVESYTSSSPPSIPPQQLQQQIDRDKNTTGLSRRWSIQIPSFIKSGQQAVADLVGRRFLNNGSSSASTTHLVASHINETQNSTPHSSLHQNVSSNGNYYSPIILVFHQHLVVWLAGWQG
jgi:hypothetical protein